MSKRYKSAMDEIKMSDELKKKIVAASAKGDTGAKRRRGKLLRTVYISAASGLAACLVLVFALHQAYVTDSPIQTELEAAQASELPQGGTAEYEAAEAAPAEPESETEGNEKTAVAKADTEKKNSAPKNDNTDRSGNTNTAVSSGERKSRAEVKTESTAEPSGEKSGSAATEARAKAQSETNDSVPDAGAQIEVASIPDAETADEEITVAKAVEEAMPEAAAESAEASPARSAAHGGGGGGGGTMGTMYSGGGSAATAAIPQPTEEPTEETEE